MLPLVVFGVLLQADSVQSELDRIVSSPKIPGIAAAVISSDGPPQVWVSGVRKEGEKDAVKLDDKWHLGSCTKAMTAAVIATLVEDKKLTWESPLSSLFPKIKVNPFYKDVTMRHLLALQGGFDPNSNWWNYQSQADLTLTQKRMKFAEDTLTTLPKDAKVGTFTYSNTSFTLAGVAASHTSGVEIEQMLSERLFKPLGIKSFGFGPTGKAQPWPHGDRGPVPEAGPVFDNAEVLTAAGRVHMSMKDWATFGQAVLRKYVGKKSAISQTYINELKNPALGGEYAMGWRLGERAWAKGKVLTHSGSNTMNFCSIWIAPNTEKAYLVAMNYGGEEARQACDDVISTLVNKFP